VRFVDTGVWMYAVGRPHPLRERARSLLRDAVDDGHRLFTSAEVLQELLHVYLPVGREATLATAMRLATASAEVVPLDAADVALAASLATEHPGLGARDLVHLAVCLRHDAIALHTFDRGLEAAFDAVG
jgi:uncharacterized protein